MTVRADGEVILLTGTCGVQDAEALLDALCSRHRPVDLAGCEQLHTALVQILLAAEAPLEWGQSPSRLPDTVTAVLASGQVSDNRQE